jgi:short-subunit dehydrogenase
MLCTRCVFIIENRVRIAYLTNFAQGLAQELKYKHSAPKVRLSLATLGFVATPMFKGQTNQSAFITPLMHVDTIGEKIVDILYSGYGQNIYLPGTMRYVACVVSDFSI